ncbi:acylphosphatase [Marivibrio halodurans]|uniref:Acylphosphatase n=1 Tax=Marivibrio halodurans TaxID=2039722 RepID=A0A8J7SLD9_9PROT|nr:acylphosphatase [Marivibrio halodurans]MBP5856161.1 acylphosphatase [Marivibrio halodurans]
MSENRETVHVMIRGKVQGVWFRAWTERTASDLGLDGWVRNRSDGSVEALFSGPPEQVAQMLRAAEEGSPLARVDDIETTSAEPPETPGFHMLPTA